MLVVVPTRGRPHNIARLWQAWQATATGVADLLVAVDGDPDNERAYRAVGVPWIEADPEWRGMIATLNRHATAHADRYDAVAFMGDDHVPRTPGWDAAMMDALDTLAPVGIVYGDDLHRGRSMPTAAALSATIVRTLGYMAPPTLGHLVCDRWWRKLGRRLGRITYLPDVVIEHMHYKAGKAPKDAGYEQVNSSRQYRRDERAFDRYVNGGGLRRDVHALRDVAAGVDMAPRPRKWLHHLGGLLTVHGVGPRGIVHVGAHLGEEADTYRRLGFDPVTLVEPNPALAAQLRALPGVAVVEAACGIETGAAILHVTEASPFASLLPPLRRPVAGTVEVPVLRLADIVDETTNVAVVDVQGAELDVVAGADLTHLDLLILETHTKVYYEGQPSPGEVVEAMRERGWRRVGEYWHDGSGRCRDLAFIPERP